MYRRLNKRQQEARARALGYAAWRKRDEAARRTTPHRCCGLKV